MNRFFHALLISCASLFLFADAASIKAQGVARGVDPTVVSDVELEKESLHNLQVARHYFKLKKAYKAALARCEEIIAGNPNFTRVDEALYLAGMSSLRLAENRGKQRADLPADKLREDARDYLSRLVTEFPDSEFRKSAEDELRSLGAVNAKREVAKP
jgi:outer membrane protein assembly factor BamD (BamD/ComL family)